jgi:hypothetical protein
MSDHSIYLHIQREKKTLVSCKQNAIVYYQSLVSDLDTLILQNQLV